MTRERREVLRLSDWLIQQIAKRQVPSETFGKYDKPAVVMKLDIENAEFHVIPDLVSSGALCATVDYCFGEFHVQAKYPPVNVPPNPRTGRGGLHLENSGQKRIFKKQILLALQSLRSSECKLTAFDDLDDESYWNDPVPIVT